MLPRAKSFIWGLRNCHSGSTNWGEAERVFKEIKSQGLIKTKVKFVKALWKELSLILVQEEDICS